MILIRLQEKYPKLCNTYNKTPFIETSKYSSTIICSCGKPFKIRYLLLLHFAYIRFQERETLSVLQEKQKFLQKLLFRVQTCSIPCKQIVSGSYS